MSAPKKRQWWRKFDFRAWRSDEDLRRCDRDVQAVWLDLCGLIYEAGDMGRLSVQDRTTGERRPYTRSELCKITGDDPRIMKRAFTQLVANGVADLTDSYLVSRRIAREQLRALQDESNGAEGGNPDLKDKDLAEKWDNPPDNPRDKAIDVRGKTLSSVPSPNGEGTGSPAAEPAPFDPWEAGTDLLLSLNPIKQRDPSARASARAILGRHHQDLIRAAQGDRHTADSTFANCIERLMLEQIEKPNGNSNPKTRLLGFFRTAEEKLASDRAPRRQPRKVRVRLDGFGWTHDPDTGAIYRTDDETRERVDFARELTDADRRVIAEAIESQRVLQAAAA